MALMGVDYQITTVTVVRMTDMDQITIAMEHRSGIETERESVS